MKQARISASDALGAALQSAKKEWEVFLLLVVFTTLVTMLYYWPTLGAYSETLAGIQAGAAGDERMLEEMNQHMSYLLIGLIPFLVIYLGAQTVWSRVAVLGRERTLEGGLKALLHRSLWVVWRYVCLIGWVLLLVAVFMLLLAAVMWAAGVSLSGLEQGQPPGAAVALLIPLYLVFLAAVMVLVFLFYVALHGEARDVRLPIHACFKAARGNLLRATGLMFLTVLVYAVIAILFLMFFGIALIGASGLPALIGMAVFMAAGSAFNFIFVGYGAYYATRLVPKLKA